jgi:glucose-6-phosphate isomerase
LQLLFDFSKNIITEKTLQLLQQLAVECNLPEAIKAMFAGEKINDSETPGVTLCFVVF